MNDTPRTDRHAKNMAGYADLWVPSYVCEELERELAEARRELAIGLMIAAEAYAAQVRAERELAEAKADANYPNGHSNFSGKAVPWAKTEQEDG